MSLSDDTTMEVLAGLRRRVDLDAASRLRLDDDIVYSVVFRRLHDGVPFVMTTVHLPPAVAHAVLSSPELKDGAVGTRTEDGRYGMLEPHLVSRSPKRHSRLRWQRPTMRSRMRWDASPVIRCCGWTGCTPMSATRPVELSVSHFLPEQYTYRVTLRRSG